SLIFVKIKEVDEMMRTVPFIFKPWMEVLDAPYCWSNIDIQKWCRRSNDENAVDLVVKKLIRKSKWSVQSFSAFRMGEPGFLFVAHCISGFMSSHIRVCRSFAVIFVGGLKKTEFVAAPYYVGRVFYGTESEGGMEWVFDTWQRM
nr:F-box protein FBW2-like [Tanacetum cinerariifolium]